MKKLKAPFPYFGGKSRVASVIWDRLGDVDNYIEPFAGSAAVLIARPHPPRIETLNDADCMVANFWRATQHDPEAVAEFADGPVNEADMHARHRWLVLSEDAKLFRQRMRQEPDFYDAKVAGWWCWGACCWIGAGWCQSPESAEWSQVMRAPDSLSGGVGVNRGSGKAGPPGGSGKRSIKIGGGDHQLGHGVHQKGLRQKRPVCATERGNGKGVNLVNNLHQKRPTVKEGQTGGIGVNSSADGHRPQLGDAYSRGRGIHGNDDAGTCAQRRAWLLDWFARLRDRLRVVRVCCGDWLRVCDSDSVTTRLGTTGIFFDPPYGALAGRDMELYAVDSGEVAALVRKYCLERGSHPQMRLVLAGYAGEGHEVLEAQGWTVEAWNCPGGYGNRTESGKENAKKERLWCSPGCQQERTLFD